MSYLPCYLLFRTLIWLTVPVSSFCLTQYLLFPFLTSQWKTPNSNENISHAHNQAARDGAVIVNYLHKFYSLAYPDQRPLVVDIAHYSLTCDLHRAQIWVHWRDDEGRRMEIIFEFSLRKENEIVDARGILKNISSCRIQISTTHLFPSFVASQD